LAAIEGEARRKRAAAADAYRAVVRSIAAGTETPAPSEVAAVLEAAGKSPADLTRAVETHQRRQLLRQHVDEADAIEAELRSIRRTIGAAEAKADAAAKERDAVRESFAGRLAEIEIIKSRGRQARQELIDTADGELAARLADAERRLQDAAHRRQGPAERAADLEKRAAYPDLPGDGSKMVEIPPGHFTTTGPDPRRLAAEKLLPAARADLDAADQEVAGIRAEIDSIKALMAEE
jgi:hypothetical protein